MKRMSMPVGSTALPVCSLGLVLVLVAVGLSRPETVAVAAAQPPVAIGEGSGHLRYPEAQTALKLQPGDTVYVRPGTYSGLSLGNLSGAADAPISVVCDSNVVFTARTPQPNDFPNIAYVRFENFRFVNYNSTCMRITAPEPRRGVQELFHHECLGVFVPRL